jgi:signal transduction histidine kinase
MRLRHLRYFVTIAEERSFNRAAERQWVAQPGLSTQIRRLERELRLQLFERHTRGVDLTGASPAARSVPRTMVEQPAASALAMTTAVRVAPPRRMEREHAGKRLLHVPHLRRLIAKFTEQLGTAIANAQAHCDLKELAQEQAALRRVATLVAHGTGPGPVFRAVADEVGALLGTDTTAIVRFEADGTATLMGGQRTRRAPGSRFAPHPGYVVASVRETGRAARFDTDDPASAGMPEPVADEGIHSALGSPILVEGELWGTITVASLRSALPADTERRLAGFTELVATAIANADGRNQLTASRARLLTAGDEARRRVVRDLHDGAQGQLVDAIVTLKLAQRALRENDGQAESLLRHALSYAERGHEQLRELAHGILPSVLTHGGLRPAVRSLVTRLDVPVRVHVPSERFPAEVEASAYFIVAEALTNVVKHSQADGAEVSASVEDGMLRVEVRDDGRGGADPAGHGLVGMSDRVAALGGRLDIDSPPGAGTRVTARIPLSAPE